MGEEYRALRDVKTALAERKILLESKPPELSSEELAGQLGEAEARFALTVRRGAALRRVSVITTRLLEEGDSAVFSGMHGELERLMSRMTGSRYTRVEMEGSLPLGVEAGGGKLGWERLSSGTKSSLALALRLAMSSRFLGSSDGFLMMDDPLVDMDPERRKAAAEVLNDCASRVQLILFTCHPGHAELLRGNLLRL
jgi:exonuclease SbcC